MDRVLSNVLLLFVTYNGRTTIRRAVEAAVAGTEANRISVLVVDNASTDGTPGIIGSIASPSIALRQMGVNAGVAKAFNVGLNHAREVGAEWVWILDQDSICESGCFRRLERVATDLLAQGHRVGGVCPTARIRDFPQIELYPYRWAGNRFESIVPPEPASRDPLIPIDSCISSGTLYRVAALADIGGFRESYFIDFVDHDCHLRLKGAGWTLWWARSAEMLHNLGKVQEFRSDGFWIEHDPVRYYYMARNMLDGYRRFGGRSGIFQFFNLLLHQIKRLIRNGQHPLRSVVYIIRGIFDALRGDFGPLSSIR